MRKYRNKLTPEEISEKIMELTDVNLYENTRRLKVVAVRALFCYILREKLNMRWTAISKFLQSKGKGVNHATVIHAINNFDYYTTKYPELKEIEEMFTFKSDKTIDEINKIEYWKAKAKKLEKHIKELQGDRPLMRLISKIPPERESDAYDKLDLEMKSWKWKYTDSSTASAIID